MKQIHTAFKKEFIIFVNYANFYSNGFEIRKWCCICKQHNWTCLQIKTQSFRFVTCLRHASLDSGLELRLTWDLHKSDLVQPRVHTVSLWWFDLFGDKINQTFRWMLLNVRRDWCVSCQRNCTMKITYQTQLQTGCNLTVCSDVSTHCPGRYKATGPCLVYQETSCCQTPLFLHELGLTDRRDWSCPISSSWTGSVLIRSSFWQIG